MLPYARGILSILATRVHRNSGLSVTERLSLAKWVNSKPIKESKEIRLSVLMVTTHPKGGRGSKLTAGGYSIALKGIRRSVLFLIGHSFTVIYA